MKKPQPLKKDGPGKRRTPNPLKRGYKKEKKETKTS